MFWANKKNPLRYMGGSMKTGGVNPHEPSARPAPPKGQCNMPKSTLDVPMPPVKNPAQTARGKIVVEGLNIEVPVDVVLGDGWIRIGYVDKHDLLSYEGGPGPNHVEGGPGVSEIPPRLFLRKRLEE